MWIVNKTLVFKSYVLQNNFFLDKKIALLKQRTYIRNCDD